ncbi:MAG: excinuclease ABC subunit C, partial [bacterium]|nr:excinuclease ABC subunit C [bacterium]
KEWPLPGLMLIDGGKPQLSAAKSVLLKPGISGLRVAALAKRKNELFLENRKIPILLKSLPREIFNLILQLRDEAHRFAISYHKRLREKSLLKS